MPRLRSQLVRALAVSAALPLAAAAQAPAADPEAPRVRPRPSLDLSIGVGSDFRMLSLGQVIRRAVDRGGRFQVGYGFRLTNLAGKNVGHVPQDAKVTNLADTVVVSLPSATAINVSAHALLEVVRDFEIGGNLDVIGFTQSGNSGATYRSNSLAMISGLSTHSRGLNAFLGGANDRGTLNAELYASYRTKAGWAVRGGVSPVHSAVTTSAELPSGTRRFVRRDLVYFVGVRLAR